MSRRSSKHLGKPASLEELVRNSTGKTESPVRTIAKYGALPIDANANSVAGIARFEAKERHRGGIERRIAEAQLKLSQAFEPSERKKIVTQIERLRREKKGKPNPSISSAAERRAREALERSKWERDNRRKR